MRVIKAPGKTTINCTVNGAPQALQSYPMERLLDVLREQLRLTGTKEGCGEGECGACSVMIDGQIVNSCLVPVAQVEGAISKPSKPWQPAISCTPCNRRSSNAAARSAASARRAWFWRR